MKITPQNVFNAAWQAFIVEGKPPSVRRKGLSPGSSECSYLGENGSKCAIGLCIPDGHPAQQFTGSVRRLYAAYPELFDGVKMGGLFSDTLWVLTQAQGILHDFCTDVSGEWKYSPANMKRIYIEFAEIYHLEIPNEE